MVYAGLGALLFMGVSTLAKNQIKYIAAYLQLDLQLSSFYHEDFTKERLSLAQLCLDF